MKKPSALLLSAVLMTNFMTNAAAESLEADLVVIGAGASGLSAALQAAENGARVVLIEGSDITKAGAEAASEALPAGSVFFHQAVHESWLSRLASVRHISPEAQRYDNAFSPAPTLAWLAATGIKFEAAKFSDHDHIKWRRVARCGELVDGEALLGCVAAAAKKRGADLRSHVRAEEILLEDGRVAGVRAVKQLGEELIVRAPAVIAAGADHVYSSQTGKAAQSDKIVYSPALPSFGIAAARRAGAQRVVPVFFRGGTTGSLCVHLSEAVIDMARQPYNVWINEKGERFADEATVFRDAGLTGTFPKRSGGSVWAVWDDATLNHVLMHNPGGQVSGIKVESPQLQQLRRELKEASAANDGVFVTANYLSELALKIGVSGDALKRSIRQYNKMAKQDLDTDFGKRPHWLRPVEGPNYYALRLDGVRSSAISGLSINSTFTVLDEKDKPIKGLYAAGVGIGNIGGVENGIFTVWTDANVLGWSVFSGRKAAVEALRESGKDKPAAAEADNR